MSTQITINDATEGKSKIGKVSLWLNIILLALLAISWVTRPKILDPEIIERVETVVETDTIYVDNVIREVELVRDTVIVHDSIPSGVSSSKLDGLEPLRTYYRSFQDSLITGRIVSLTRGELLEQKLFYKSLKPEVILKTVTNTEYVTERIIVKQSFLQAGLDIGVAASGLQVNPMIGYSHHSGYSVFYRYSPWEGGGHSVGFMSPIRIPWLNL